MIRDSVLKCVKFENLLDENYIANVQTNPGCTTEDIADYIKPIVRRKTRYYTSPHWHRRSYKQCKCNE